MSEEILPHITGEYREHYLIHYGMIQERLRQNCRNVSQNYEDLLKLGFGIDCMANLKVPFDMENPINEIQFTINFKSSEDKEKYEELLKQCNEGDDNDE